MKRLFLWCAMLGLASAAAAQSGGKEAAADYTKQYDKLYKAYVDDTNDVLSMLSLSSFYSQESNPMQSFSLAMKYADRAVTTYRAMIVSGENHRAVTRLIKQGITIEVAQKRREEALLQASRYVVASRSITAAELDDLSRNCGDSPAMQRLIEKKKIIMACDKAQKDNTMNAYKDFILQYPNTSEAYDCQVLMGKMAGKMFRKALSWSEVDSLLQPYQGIETVERVARDRKSALTFDTVQAKGNAEEIYRYLSRYPYTSQYEKALDDIDIDLEKQLETMTAPQQVVDFINRNEVSPLSDVAMKKLRRMIVEDHNVQAAQLYFKEFPSDQEYMGLYQIYYEWYATEGNRNPLDNFARQNPNFPYRQELQSDLALSAVVDSMNLLQPFSEERYADYLKYVFAIAGKDMTYVAMLRTLQPAIAAKNWNAVVQRMAEFAPSFEFYSSDLLERLYSVIDAVPDVRKTVRSEVSPKYQMLNPVITSDGRCLYYTQQQEGQAGVHLAHRVSDKHYKWVSAGAVKFVNGDNKETKFYGLYDGGKRMLLSYGGDLWTAVSESPETWQLVEKLPSPVNTENNDFDAFMLEDGSGLLLASDRPGGMNIQTSGAYFHGDTAVASDLYYIPRLSDGWGEPVNLGPNVNSIFCERSPLLSSDLKTLYFISDGHAGMGYGDICYATRTDVNDWTGWGEAKNYGKEVNTGSDERSVSFSADGNRLVFCSNRTGNYSCYSVPATEGNAAAPQTVAVGSREPARVQIVDMSTHTVLAESAAVGEATSCCLYPSKFYLAVPKEYANREIYVPAAKVTFSAGASGQTPSFMLKGYYPAVLTNYEGTAEETPTDDIPLPAIHFVGATTGLQPEAKEELDNLASFLKRNKNVRADLSLRVQGDDDKECFLLGRQRSVVILQYMKEKGLSGKSVSVSNYGKSDKKGTPPCEATVSLHLDQ